MEWEALVDGTGSTSPFLADTIATALRHVQAALVLLTPDDVVSLHPALLGTAEAAYETMPAGQPRPNVLIELGMARAILPKSTIIVQIGYIRPIADLAGLNLIKFDGTNAALGRIVERLKMAGCAVDDRGSDWRRTGRFARLQALTRQPPDGESAPPRVHSV
jgi:predicted nucleotide-binding protein